MHNPHHHAEAEAKHHDPIPPPSSASSSAPSSIERRLSPLHGDLLPVVLLRGRLRDGLPQFLLKASGPALARDLTEAGVSADSAWVLGLRLELGSGSGCVP